MHRNSCVPSAVEVVEKLGLSNMAGKVKKVNNKGKDKVCKSSVVKSRVQDHTPTIAFQQFLIRGLQPPLTAPGMTLKNKRFPFIF